METMPPTDRTTGTASIWQSLVPLDRWTDWSPHMTVPGDPDVLKDMVDTAFSWLKPKRIELVRYEDAVILARRDWQSIDRLVTDRYIKRLTRLPTDDGTLLRCMISSLYKGAHAQALWSGLVQVPAQITIMCTLSEAVRLLLFYGTYFKNLEQPEYEELEPMLMLYENGFMPVGLARDGTLYVITG